MRPRRDNEDGEIAPSHGQRMRHRGSISPWVWVVVGVASLSLLSCCGVSAIWLLLSQASGSRGPVRDVALNEEVPCGDLSVTVTFVGTGAFTSQGRTGELMHEPALLVDLSIKNKRADRALAVGSQVDYIYVFDDVGNTYNQLWALDQFGDHNAIRGQIEPGAEPKIQSGKLATDRLVFPKAATEANKLFVELDLRPYGGTGRIRVTVDRERFSPSKK